MLETPLALFWPAIGVTAVVRFVLHMLAIWLGTKAVGIKENSCVQVGIITVVSYVVMFFAKILLWPLGLFMFGLFGFFVAILSVAVATKFMVDTEWGKAWSVGFIAAMVWVVLSILLP